MEESFERRPLLDRELLRALQTRTDLHSALRLALQVSGFALCAGAIVVSSELPWVAAPLAVTLGGITASFFAPFHECIHQTAFRSRRANRAAAWIAAIPFCMAPSVYRAFHWEHHRHTQDPERDPELLADPASARWPRDTAQWLRLWSGALYFGFNLLALRLAVTPLARWDEVAPWAGKAERPRLAWESRVIAAFWIALAVAAMAGIRGTGWIHAEHHAWPAIPWHRLRETHAQVAAHVEQQGSAYWRLQADAFRKRKAA